MTDGIEAALTRWDTLQAKMDAGYAVAVRCLACGHEGRIPLTKVVERHGADALSRSQDGTHLDRVGRCTVCGGSGVEWVVERPGAPTIRSAIVEGWRVAARCFNGRPSSRKGTRPCGRTQTLDLQVLAWLLGEDFPLEELPRRLCCPGCKVRRVELLYSR
jgi:hypothetical protein